MKFTCRRADFHEALKVVSRVVSEKSTLPILHNIEIKPGEGEVALSATDLELAVCLKFPATVEDPTPLTLPAKLLAEFVSGLGEGDMTVEVDERNTGIIKQRKTSFKILGLPSEEFPPLPEVKEGASFQISEANLARLIRSVGFAVSVDDTRPVLTSIKLQYIVAKKKPAVLKLAATDTHRLSVRSCEVEPSTEKDAHCLVPSRTFAELLKNLRADGEDLVTVQFDDNQIRFTTDALTMVSRLVGGQYPKYERVIPTSHAGVFTVPSAELLPIIQRAAIVAKSNANKVFLTIKPEEGVAVVSAKAGDVGEIEDELPLQWISEEGSNEERRFTLNFRFLVDVLSLRESEIARFEITQGVRPIVYRPAEGIDWLCVVMPMNTEA